MQVILIFISATTFIFYGLLCLSTDHMKAEFIRYKLVKYRKLTGCLEILGGAGQLIGFFYTPFLVFSSLGLATLMFMGTAVRVRTKDKFWSITPAFGLMIVNIYIVIEALRKI